MTAAVRNVVKRIKRWIRDDRARMQQDFENLVWGIRMLENIIFHA